MDLKEDNRDHQEYELNHKEYKLEDYLCPQQSVNMTLYGQYHSEVFQYFRIAVIGCQLPDES
jgi:hypothetical protein